MSHRLQVLVPEELDLRLRKAAKRRRLSKGAWVRQALERALREESRHHDPVRALAALEGPTGDIDEMLGELARGRGL